MHLKANLRAAHLEHEASAFSSGHQFFLAIVNGFTFGRKGIVSVGSRFFLLASQDGEPPASAKGKAQGVSLGGPSPIKVPIG